MSLRIRNVYFTVRHVSLTQRSKETRALEVIEVETVIRLHLDAHRIVEVPVWFWFHRRSLKKSFIKKLVLELMSVSLF